MACLALPLVFAALAGSPAAQTLKLNLGPGDSPYISGFLPQYEIDDKVATHWTTYDARVDLPLSLQNGIVELSYRFARVLPQTAVVEVFFGNRLVDRFDCRGGIVREQRVSVEVTRATPAVVTFHVDSHDRKNLGLKMDWLLIESQGNTRVALRGLARWRPALLVTVLFVLFRGVSVARWLAVVLVLPWTLAGASGLVLRPWLTHRLLTGLPESLFVLGVIGLVTGKHLVSRGVSGEAVRAAVALASTAFLVRSAAINHPDFYYPDLMTHERLVEVLRETGPRFLLSPQAHLEHHGAWSKPAYGGVSSLPYAPTFHALFAVFPLDYDTTLTAFKLVGAAVSTLPLVLLLALARHLVPFQLPAPKPEVPITHHTSTPRAVSSSVEQVGTALGVPWAALLMLLVPTYTSRLSFALLPALLGHAADMAVLLFLALRLERLRHPRVWVQGAALLAAAQLTYVSSVVNLSLLLGLLGSFLALERQEDHLRQGLRVAALGLAGSAIAVLVFYRDFLGTGWDLALRIAERGATATTRYPVESWLALVTSRTLDFFDHAYPVLAAFGFVGLLRRGRCRPLLAAWALTYFLLLLLRAKLPDVFRYGHETLLMTPLVCLAAGECLAWLWGRGGWRRALAIGVFAFLALQGGLWQWRAVALQLGNAL